MPVATPRFPAKATASLKQKDIRGSLINSYSNSRWGMYDSFGLWIYNPYFGAFSFLPFGNRWYSPYGFGFGYGMDWSTIPWWYRKPSTVYVPRDTSSSVPVKERRRGAIETPPYRTVEKQTQRQIFNDNPGNAWPAQRSGTSRGAEPVFSQPAQAPAQRSERPVRSSSSKANPID